jgi:hypothetical protein
MMVDGVLDKADEYDPLVGGRGDTVPDIPEATTDGAVVVGHASITVGYWSKSVKSSWILS